MEVFAGLSEILTGDHPHTNMLHNLTHVASKYRNKMLYEWRQTHFANQARYREHQRTGTPYQPFKLPTPTELGHLGRGTLVREGNRFVKGPGETALAGMLGGNLVNVLERNVNAGFDSYWKLLKDYHAEKIAFKPSIPGYSQGTMTIVWPAAKGLKTSKDGLRVSFPGAQSKNRLSLPTLTVPIPLRAGLASGEAKLVSVTVQPLRGGRVRLIWTTKETGRGGVPHPEQPASLLEALASGPVASGDFGVRNLLAVTLTDLRAEARRALPTPAATTVSSLALPGPLLVRGASLIDQCHRHNQGVSSIKKSLPYPKGGKQGKKNVHRQRHSHRLSATFENYANRMEGAVRTTLKPLFEYLEANHVKAFIVGWNKGIKTGSSMGRKNNRRFGSIPFERIRKVIEYWCMTHGVLYIETPESHTSKTSFGDGELPQHHAKYVGRRVTRDIFKTSTGVRVNADVNGSMQILVKHLKKMRLLHLLTPVVRGEVWARILNPTSTKPVARTRRTKSRI